MTTEEMIEFANQLTSQGSAIVDAINAKENDALRAANLSDEAKAEIEAAHEAAIAEALAREVTPETAAAAIAARQAGQ